MKYMILLFDEESQWETATEGELTALMQAHDEFVAWLGENNIQILGGEELQPSSTSLNIRSDGAEIDGPFFEIKEQLGGFYLIETDSPDLAREAVRHVPNYGVAELRPVMQHDT